MSETRAPYMIVSGLAPEELQAAVVALAEMRRQALLRELGDLERLLGVSPTTRELRRADRKPDQLVRIEE